jgi:hypothetical protein
VTSEEGFPGQRGLFWTETPMEHNVSDFKQTKILFLAKKKKKKKERKKRKKINSMEI